MPLAPAQASSTAETPPGSPPPPPALQLLRSPSQTRATSSLIPYIGLGSIEPLEDGHASLAIDTALPPGAAPELSTSPQSVAPPSYHTSHIDAPPYAVVPPDVPSLPQLRLSNGAGGRSVSLFDSQNVYSLAPHHADRFHILLGYKA
ncbi:hypothetical protein FA95DRAFT_1551701 [Auriscalpium vulgare]|uniref:Uncharacterized protein n=1 Tax=Auriscalpium vulgare TaxID=40419 RepID=A0ACB8SBR4_9AGAM|nr:hypothetical protein FA95DRAFT_1551701 [Auriscalpium vulgare]